MFFQPAEFPVCARLETRIAALLDWPLENGEGLQVLRYRPGAEYKPHYDYFDPAEPGTPTILKRGGQRVGSLVCYLNTPEAGGATVFPDVGLEVAPVQGNAVFFSYDRPHPSTRTLHGGAPVIAGEKWVATKWMREGPLRVSCRARARALPRLVTSFAAARLARVEGGDLADLRGGHRARHVAHLRVAVVAARAGLRRPSSCATR